MIARWRPSPAVEILSFWNGSSDYDERGRPDLIVMANAALAAVEHEGRFDGAPWGDIRSESASAGLFASVAPALRGLVRPDYPVGADFAAVHLLVLTGRAGEAQACSWRTAIESPYIGNWLSSHQKGRLHIS